MVGIAFQVAQAGVGFYTELARPLLHLFLGPLVERVLVEPQGDLVVLVGRGIAQEHGHAFVAFGHDLDLLLIARGEGIIDVGLHQFFQLVHVALALLIVDKGDDGGREIEDPLQLLRGDIEQVTHTTGHTLEVPDVAHGRG